ncbi:NUDIX hydrolase [Martelella limonii]|uniref:NUDIX hydrolase n=1 Tax=Martelella limonii TaxID=1647649 RepID=UPI001581056C|nr:NUDIX domain-containing protein [Martelella limonii]
MDNVIRIAVALIINDRGEMLTVRKRGTSAFMQPGGKIDAGETPVAALIRELGEELALKAAPEDFAYEGRYREQAANEPGMIVEADAFSWLAAPAVSPQAEIEEVKWLPVDGPITEERAALSRNHLFPIARKRHAEARRHA